MKKFDIITEADARTLDIGATVELAATGHVTPLARDTLAARRVTVVRAGSRDEGLPSDLAPANDIRRVAIGNDHTGLAMKRTLVEYLRRRGIAVTDVGTNSTESVDYPDIAAAVAKSVSRGESDAGIAIDGGGVGPRARDRRCRNRLGDRRQQGSRHPRRDVFDRNDRQIFTRTQRRERLDTGHVAHRQSGERDTHR